MLDGSFTVLETSAVVEVERLQSFLGRVLSKTTSCSELVSVEDIKKVLRLQCLFCWHRYLQNSGHN